MLMLSKIMQIVMKMLLRENVIVKLSNQQIFEIELLKLQCPPLIAIEEGNEWLEILGIYNVALSLP